MQRLAKMCGGILYEFAGFKRQHQPKKKQKEEGVLTEERRDTQDGRQGHVSDPAKPKAEGPRNTTAVSANNRSYLRHRCMDLFPSIYFREALDTLHIIRTHQQRQKQSRKQVRIASVRQINRPWYMRQNPPNHRRRGGGNKTT